MITRRRFLPPVDTERGALSFSPSKIAGKVLRPGRVPGFAGATVNPTVVEKIARFCRLSCYVQDCLDFGAVVVILEREKKKKKKKKKRKKSLRIFSIEESSQIRKFSNKDEKKFFSFLFFFRT